jgi:hypothetical protein
VGGGDPRTSVGHPSNEGTDRPQGAWRKVTYEPVARSEKIQLTVQEYEKIRAQPTCFVVHVGHDVPGVETVVETNERYALVKSYVPGNEWPKKLDPRSRN